MITMTQLFSWITYTQNYLTALSSHQTPDVQFYVSRIIFQCNAAVSHSFKLPFSYIDPHHFFHSDTAHHRIQAMQCLEFYLLICMPNFQGQQPGPPATHHPSFEQFFWISNICCAGSVSLDSNLPVYRCLPPFSIPTNRTAFSSSTAKAIPLSSPSRRTLCSFPTYRPPWRLHLHQPATASPSPLTGHDLRRRMRCHADGSESRSDRLPRLCEPASWRPWPSSSSSARLCSRKTSAEERTSCFQLPQPAKFRGCIPRGPASPQTHRSRATDSSRAPPTRAPGVTVATGALTHSWNKSKSVQIV